jgi:hypothetical protein
MEGRLFRPINMKKKKPEPKYKSEQTGKMPIAALIIALQRKKKS